MANDLKPPGTVLEYDATPSEKAKAIVAEIRARWGTLYGWGIRTKLAEDKSLWESWERFVARWDDNDPDVLSIGGQAEKLNLAEEHAEKIGYARPGRPVETIGIVEATVAGEGVDKGVKAVEGAIDDANAAIKAIPWFKVLVGAGLLTAAGGVVALIVTWKAAPYALPILTEGMVPFPRSRREPRGDREEDRMTWNEYFDR